MEFMKSFMDQSMIAIMGEIALFANTVTMECLPFQRQHVYGYGFKVLQLSR